MSNQLYFMLGLCQKAGKLLSGEFMCEQSIRKKTAYMTIIAQDASDNTKKNFTDLCKYYKIPLYIWGTKESLGKSIGKELRASLVVTDMNFSKKIRELLNEAICNN